METFPVTLPFFAKITVERLEAAGFEAFVVGGCVRDAYLGKNPNDWDVTTSATPTEMKEVFADFRTVETGIKHGTLTVLADGTPVEITTYRADGEYLDHRHPKEVTFSRLLSEDLKRRDFTVNAMAYSPKCGTVDLFGGMEDLRRGIIRTVGDPDTRFEEDGLRILRGLRFASVLGFSIENATADSIHRKKDLLNAISAERIREEFAKLLCGKNAVPILREYADVCGVFLPELTACIGFSQNTKYHCYDVFEHLLHALDAESTGDLTLRLAVLLHDVGKPLCYTEDAFGGHFKGHGEMSAELTERILRRLKCDRQTVEDAVLLVRIHDRPISADKKSVKRLMAKLREENILRLLELKRCDRVAHAKDFSALPAELAEIPAVMAEIKRENDCFSLRQLAINGRDLQEIGISPGKEMGEILNALLEKVVDETLPNDKDCLLQAAKSERNF